MTLRVPRHGGSGPNDERYAQRMVQRSVEEIASLEQSPQMIDATWNTVALCVQARSLVDPWGSGIDTWEAVVNAMQVGSAIFRTASTADGPVECRIHHEMRSLPATGPRSYANAPMWLNAFWFAIICRDRARLTELSEVPMDVLRASGAEHDEYLYHWVATLQAYWLGQQPRMVEELTATFEGSHPDAMDIAARDWLQNISYPPVNLFYRFVRQDHAGFNAALAEALELHKSYWSATEEREESVEGMWAIGPLAIACLAYDGEFPLVVESEYLPKQLLNRSWLGEFDI